MEDIKKALKTRREKLTLSPERAVSTGSTLLNLACSSNPYCGFLKGGYYYLIGDSTSGKTWLSMTCFAESIINKSFSDYELIFDDVEGGALMDIEHYFGKKVAQKMQRRSSDTIQDFYRTLYDLIQKGKKFIYVLDSQDALDSEEAEKKFGKQKKAKEEGTKAAGSFGDGKAKIHSMNIRWVLRGLKKTGSILIIIGQTRDNLGFGFEKKTRAGGKALKFYANIEIWTSVGKKIKKTVRGIPRTIGVNCLAEIRKNRISGRVGKERTVEIPIYYGLGIDDIGSCVNYLIAEKHWKKDGEKFRAHDIKVRGSKSGLISFIEKKGLEDTVREITAQVWREIEDECEIKGRKKRYE